MMAVSDATRQWVADAGATKARRDREARAAAADETDEFIAERKHARAREAILRGLVGGEPVSRRDLRQSLKSDIRDCFDPAMAELVSGDKPLVIAVELEHGQGYSLR